MSSQKRAQSASGLGREPKNGQPEHLEGRPVVLRITTPKPKEDVRDEHPDEESNSAGAAKPDKDAEVTASAAEPKVKNKRQQKQEDKKAKQKLADEAKKGTIVVPKAKGADLNPQEPVHHADCGCTYCKCKFCADPAGLTLCGDSVEETCPICANINRLLHNQALELSDVWKAQLQDTMQAQDDAWNAKLADVMQAKDDLEKGLLEERCAEIAKERQQHQLRERNDYLKAQVAELRTKAAERKQVLAEIRRQIEIEEAIEKQNKERKKKKGTVWVPE